MALTDNLVSYWKLDEASGDALDAHGSNTLTEHGTGGVGTATGIINGGRDFETSDSDYFNHTDNTDLSTGDIDFTIAGWVKLESTATTQSAVAKTTGSSGEFFMYFSPGQMKFLWQVYGSSGFGGSGLVKHDTFGTVTTGIWYFLVVWHDSVNNLIGISINDVADTTAHSAGVYDGTGDFFIGGDAFSQWFDGLIDEVGFWKRVLTSAERTSLYNSGAGFAYPFSGGGDDLFAQIWL